MPVPSKLIGEATISPVISNVLAFWSFVAVEIVPVIAPENVDVPFTVNPSAIVTSLSLNIIAVAPVLD